MVTQKTVLVIEDNPTNMKLVRTLLTLGHYEVLEAADAESGIKLATSKIPDLILMDIQLPGMDGLEATTILKNDPATKDIPIVALTSYAMRGDEEKARQAGCDGYITKPINTRTFLDTISGYLTTSQKYQE